MSLKIVSFFSGAGGLDLGFKNSGFDIIYANEFDKDIWDTYKFNHPETILDTRSITLIDENEIPDCMELSVVLHAKAGAKPVLDEVLKINEDNCFLTLSVF